MLRLAISGRLRASAMNLFRLLLRKATSCPERSSSKNVNPPDVPTPGIAGGEKLKATPSGSLLNSAFRCCLIACICCARSLRLPHSLKAIHPKAL